MIQQILAAQATLKDNGFRLTKIRKLILEVFFSNTTVPISATELKSQLFALDTKVNKTTVYRELEFLSAQGIIVEVNAGDGKKRYELNCYCHHHHVLCLRCSAVECVTIDNCTLEEQLNSVDLKNFKITGHALNFFGLCAQCR
ncbi:MAG: transcriptional repressor [Nitrospirae bacterium]|nr:transcriptional repressor [Nitrospirota bacterium]MBF0520920.1 transcriptional repressor [Nitrospirota bacterium]MBF0534113.1 transcriptional repressor [Nitrospirota bacterium]MBF0617000.1 transcriptional repressor [Nitrospirota bacterium]